MQVVELRNYLLTAGRTADFLRYFEEHFLVSQRDEEMHVLGQFAVVDQPDRFVWIRGFADMKTRLRGLNAFYGGPFWQARRDTANAMIREHHDVHLLRPLVPVDALTAGARLEDRASASPGALAPEGGLVVIDFLRSQPGTLGSLVRAFENTLRPALRAAGHRVLAHFVTEPTPNDYPRLPVVQDPDLLVVVSAYPDRASYARLRSEASPGALGHHWPIGVSPAGARSLVLQPTGRSLIRYSDVI
jgi:hypothetical protein